MNKMPKRDYTKKILIIFILFFAVFLANCKQVPTSAKQENESQDEMEILVTNLDTPWAIDFLPDGRMIFTERPGKVSIFDNGKTKIAGNIKVSEESESGLMGVAVDTEFNKNKFIYLYYTHKSGNMVSRFKLNEKLEDEFALIDGIPNARFHDGGRIKFGPDGMIYITTGDATVPSSSQDINSLAGKILRMNKDGSIPKDNPFSNYVYSYGHRNPQGLAWNLITKELYASEHGPTRKDEINLIEKGNNYGWPNDCKIVSDEYVSPLRCYNEFTLAPAGIAFYKNGLYVAGLRGAQLRKIVFADGKILQEEEVLNDLGRVREVVEHNGYLYIATSNRDGRGLPGADDDKIIRIKA